MKDPKAVIPLGASDVQAVERAVLDGDADAALEFLKETLWPAIDRYLKRGRCQPVFELPRGHDLSAIRPPSSEKPADE